MTLRRFVPLAVVVALLALAAVAATLATPGIHSVPIPRPAYSQALASHNAVLRSAGITPGSPPPPAHVTQVPGWLKALVTAVFAGLVVALIVFLVWRLVLMGLTARAERVHRATPAGEGFATPREAVIAAVDDILATLATDDGDARAAVIASWLRLEDLAAEAGTPRSPGDSPTDLVERLLAAHQVSSAVLRSLADVYRTARYSTREVDESMRHDARAALGLLRAELLVTGAEGEPDEPEVRRTPSPRPSAPDTRRPSPVPAAPPPAPDADPHAAYRRPSAEGDA